MSSCGYGRFNCSSLTTVNAKRVLPNGSPEDATRFPPTGTRVHGHHVKFFNQSNYPAQQIGDYLHGSLVHGGSAVVFASAPHRQHIAEALQRCGADVAALNERGQLVWGDADDVAQSIVVDGVPDESVFQRLVGDVINRTTLQHGRDRAYGEIVDVLMRAGDSAAALQLERWWNQLLREKPVELLCGYAIDGFADADAAVAFRHICDEHEKIELTPAQDSREHSYIMAELQQATAALRAESRRRIASEHAHESLRAQAELANKHFTASQRLTSGLADVSRPADIARVALAELKNIFAADVLAIGVITGAKLSLLGNIGLVPAQIDKYRMLAADAPLPMAAAWRSGKPVWLYSPSDIGQQYPAMLEAVPHVRALGALPLVSQGRTLGVVEIEYHTCPPSEALPCKLLEDCVTQIASVLERALAYEEAQRACLRLQILTDAASRIECAKLDLTQTLKTLAHEITHAGFADCCAVNLLAEDGKTLALAALQHVDPASGAASERILRTAAATNGESVFGEAIQTGQAVRLSAGEDESKLLPLTWQSYFKEGAVTSLLIVPLLASGKAIGTLAVSRNRLRQPFTEADEQLLSDLAGRAALAIDNALLYEQARRDLARAESENAAKDQFLAMLGHELRNPLAPILTAAQLMQMRTGKLLAKERTIIERQVNHLVRLVDDLLDISRITSGKIELNRKQIELAEVTANAVEIAKPLLEERRHRLIVSVASDLVVEADEFRLAQVVTNLLTNAAKYTPHNGTIEIIASAQAGTAVLRVRDNGIGIEPTLLPRVFDVFTQGKQAGDRAVGGLGLGLAIARRLVELHGGTVRAHSEGKGHGSEFVVELPLVRAAPHEQKPATITLAGGHKILVVDDVVDAAEALAELLRMIGHTVHIAHDGLSALAAAETFRPELALLNIGLPAMDGHELGRRLRAAHTDPCPKLVAITGYGQVTDRLRSEELGFVWHLVKPIDFERLKAVIDDCFPAP